MWQPASNGGDTRILRDQPSTAGALQLAVTLKPPSHKEKPMGIISGGVVMPGPASAEPLQKGGPLVANDFAHGLVVGRRAIDTVNGMLWICTAANGTTTSTWTVVGAQT